MCGYCVRCPDVVLGVLILCYGCGFYCVRCPDVVLGVLILCYGCGFYCVRCPDLFCEVPDLL